MTETIDKETGTIPSDGAEEIPRDELAEGMWFVPYRWSKRAMKVVDVKHPRDHFGNLIKDSEITVTVKFRGRDQKYWVDPKNNPLVVK
jgi:hypothetical protein